MILAVFFGPRSWTDAHAIEEVVDRLLLEGDGSLKGVHGKARGLDMLADAVLRRRGFLPVAVPARWTEHDRYGHGPVPCRCAPPRPREDDVCRAAGIRRNQLIIDEYVMPAIEEPGTEVWACCFSTPAGSPGTNDMRARLRPLVEAGKVRGIAKVAKGPMPAERRKPRQGVPMAKVEPWPTDVA
jgi:YspA, cpYpsA-related SLOG family